jgi:pilus assembly protein CpaE
MAEDSLRILIVEDSILTARMLREMLDAQPDFNVVATAQTGQDGVRRAVELHPDVILMDIHLPDVDGIQATWLISSKNPDSSVIIVTSEERPEFMQRAMLAGAQGYVLKPVRDAHELASTIRTVRQRYLERRALITHPGSAGAAPSMPPPQLGKRVAIFRAKGGQGATSVAVNLAVTLRALTQQPVVLVDFDLRFGDANILLDLPFERSIIDLLPHINELESHVFDQVLARHSSGVQLLMRPDRAELAEKVSAEDIEKILTQLPRYFDYVLIDCELSYDDKLLAVLDRADFILLVLTPDLGAVRNTQYFLQLAKTLGYPRNKIAFVLNRAKTNAGLGPADVEHALGEGRCFRLDSYGRLLTSSVNMGTPAVQAQPRSEFARVIHQIAEYIRHGGDDPG